MRCRLALVVCLALLAAGCSSDSSDETTEPATPDAEGLAVSTDAFTDGGDIPVRHTCDGDDVSPRIFMTGISDNAVELALIMDDPDAGGFVHWIAAAVPVTAREFAEGEAAGQYTPGPNDFGRTGYGGPCPPPGDGPHEYRLTLHALGQAVGVDSGASAADLRAEIEAASVGNAVFSGRYER